MDLNQTLQTKFPHLEINTCNFNSLDDDFLILGSDFYSKSKEIALAKIKSDKRVIDYFTPITKSLSGVTEKAFVYDLTHSLGNFMDDVELFSGDFGSGKKLVAVGDFVISRLRSYLKEMVVIQSKNFKQFVSSEYLVYRPKTDEISSDTLMVFALTKEVQTILNKSQYGTEHPRFYDFVFERLPIPNVVFELNSFVSETMQKAYSSLQNSKQLYKEAENLLYAELGLDPNDPLKSILGDKENLNIQIKTLKESFLRTGRLDSEYYQVKFEKIENIIKSYKNSYCVISDCFSQNKTVIDFLQKAYNYVEIGDISVNNGDIKYNQIDTNELPSNAKISLKKNDILISKVRPNRGAIAIVNCELENLVGTNAFTVLREKTYYKKEVLQVLLKSDIYKTWLLKFNVGTSYPVIKDEDILTLPIPKIDQNVQISIASNLQKSFALRKEAKELLDKAKFNIEAAIERERERER